MKYWPAGKAQDANDRRQNVNDTIIAFAAFCAACATNKIPLNLAFQFGGNLLRSRGTAPAKYQSMKKNVIKPTRLFSQFASFCLLTLVAAIPAYASDSQENRGQLSAADYKFACEAARAGMMEITLGNAASQKSTDTAVQQFGQRMVTDHGKAGDQLKQIATQKGATLPAELTAVQQKHVDHLNSLSSPDFDKAYLAMMVKDHKEVLKEFERAAKDAQDPDLRAFAANTVPVVQEHLKMAEDLRGRDKVAASETK